jgi:hypothetical protein
MGMGKCFVKDKNGKGRWTMENGHLIEIKKGERGCI